MKTDSEIKKDALVMGLLYSVFGFLGIALFCIGSWIGITAKFPLLFTIMWYIPLVVGLGMFWFSWKVYKWNLESDRNFYKTLNEIRSTMGETNQR